MGRAREHSRIHAHAARGTQLLVLVLLASVGRADRGSVSPEMLNSREGSRRTVSRGDPHVTTLDKLTLTYVGCGDHIMMMTRDGSFMYQARHCIRSDLNAATTCAVAVKCSYYGDVAELYTSANEVRLLINQKEHDVPSLTKITASDLSVERRESEIIISCGGKAGLAAMVRAASGLLYLDVMVEVSKRMWARTVGLHGTWDDDLSNDIAFRNGTLWNGAPSLTYVNGLVHGSLDDVQASWTVGADESLFTVPVKSYGCRASASERRTMLQSRFADDDTRIEARNLCAMAGLTGTSLLTCAFDFIASGGDPDFIKHAAHNLRLDMAPSLLLA